MDYKLVRRVARAGSHPAIAGLRTRVVTPSELGRWIRLRPVHPVLLSGTGASWPVHGHLHWPDQRRRTLRPR